MGEEQQLRRLLSAARLAPYEAAAARDRCDALTLYTWNVRISAAFFEDIHYVEVGFRNTVDACLQREFGDEWFDTPGLLSTYASRTVREARRRARSGTGRQTPPHGKTVAELPFGFWWSLLADEYNRTLWQPALQGAFAGPVRRRTLHQRLDDLRRLRNRIAHHEPIHGRDLVADHALVHDLAARIHPDLGSHLARTSRVALVLEQRPPVSPGGCPQRHTSTGDASETGVEPAGQR